MFLERGFAVKESEECGTNGTRALHYPEEAPGARAVMHNYAPEGYKFQNAMGLGVFFRSCKKQEHSRVGAVKRVMSHGPPGMEAGKIRGHQEQERPRAKRDLARLPGSPLPT